MPNLHAQIPGIAPRLCGYSISLAGTYANGCPEHSVSIQNVIPGNIPAGDTPLVYLEERLDPLKKVA